MKYIRNAFLLAAKKTVAQFVRAFETIFKAVVSLKEAVILMAITGPFIAQVIGTTTLLFMCAISIFLLALSHMMRKLAFPYINGREAWEQAKKEPLSSSLVICALAFLLSVVLVISYLTIRA